MSLTCQRWFLFFVGTEKFITVFGSQALSFLTTMSTNLSFLTIIAVNIAHDRDKYVVITIGMWDCKIYSEMYYID